MTAVQTAWIPSELQARRQWVAWTREERDGKPTKVPRRPGANPGGRAKSDESSSWGTYDAAVASLPWADGIGYVFSGDDPYAGVDLDACRDPETGRLDQHAAAVVLALDSYTEASPSGRGVHIIIQASVPGERRRIGNVEMYDRLRFFTVTGEQIHGEVGVIKPRQAELDELYAELFPPPAPVVRTAPSATPLADDRDLIEQAHAAANGGRFAALWAGSWEGAYTSQSEADAAFARCSPSGPAAKRSESTRCSGSPASSGRSGTVPIIATEPSIWRLQMVLGYSPTRNVGPALTPHSKPNNRSARKHLDVFYEGGSDVSGGRCDLTEVLGVFDELLYLPDHGAVLVALAGIVANYATGDPVWPLLVGPPGCGKSEIISALTGAPGVWSLSSLTPQTLLSGFERKGTPASLLLQIGEFGILAFKDLTTVLTMHREARAQIVGQLREVADG